MSDEAPAGEAPAGEAPAGEGPEMVYAVPKDVLFDGLDPWLGVKREGLGGVLGQAEKAGRYVPRPEAEKDRSIKQIIPYLVLADGDRIFLMKRTRAGSDERLHDLYTIGVGVEERLAMRRGALIWNGGRSGCSSCAAHSSRPSWRQPAR